MNHDECRSPPQPNVNIELVLSVLTQINIEYLHSAAAATECKIKVRKGEIVSAEGAESGVE